MLVKDGGSCSLSTFCKIFENGNLINFDLARELMINNYLCTCGFLKWNNLEFKDDQSWHIGLGAFYDGENKDLLKNT